MGVLPRCPRSIATTFRVARRAEHGGKSIVHTAGLPRRLLAEFAGTALLVTVVVGSGIAAAQLSPDDVGLQLLENSTATVFGLAVLILMFGPVSSAHFNPVVTAADSRTASLSPANSPSPGLTRSSKPPTSSSRCVSAIPAPSFRETLREVRNTRPRGSIRRRCPPGP